MRVSPLLLLGATLAAAQLIGLTIYISGTVSGTVLWNSLTTWIGLAVPLLANNVVIDRPVTVVVQGSGVDIQALT